MEALGLQPEAPSGCEGPGPSSKVQTQAVFCLFIGTYKMISLIHTTYFQTASVQTAASGKGQL